MKYTVPLPTSPPVLTRESSKAHQFLPSGAAQDPFFVSELKLTLKSFQLTWVKSVFGGQLYHAHRRPASRGQLAGKA